MTTVINTNQLSKTFGDVAVLKPLDLTVAEHAIFGFLGPNGAGKTTLMKLLLGLIRPTGGSATILAKISWPTAWRFAAGWVICRKTRAFTNL